MTSASDITFAETDLDAIASFNGRVAVVITPSGKMGPGARRANRLTKGALKRLVESEAWEKMKPGEIKTIGWPTGMEAEALDVLCHERGADQVETRKAGAALARVRGTAPLLVLGASVRRMGDFAQGIALRSYAFTARKSEPGKGFGAVTVMVTKPDEAREMATAPLAIAEGVLMTRDLVSEPANHLTTMDFADRIKALEAEGLKITILEEADLEKLGMGLLLSVGMGSVTPTKVAVMEWAGGRSGDAPLALVGKGVIFDTGGISLKPAAGMEDMTMDMGGAGTVVGTMKALAGRKAKANVVGVVGLVENMPAGNASRPGDVVTSMKGDTVEIINTDAEGRLLLADVLWYTQETYKPQAVIDLATLTGAIIVALGHEHAGVFSNDDSFADKFIRAAGNEGEGAWRMPLGDAYDKLIKSNIADIKNVGGRKGGAITAAQFIQRFVKQDMPWIHLDIAGAARVDGETSFAPKGATGWGVMALNRLIADQYEGED